MLTRITDFIWDCIFSLAIFAMSDEDRRKYDAITKITTPTTEEESNGQEVEVHSAS